MLHCLFNKNRIIESFTEDDDGTKYKPYDTQNPTIQNISLLTAQNGGNIKVLKEQVDKLNKELKLVTDLSGRVYANTKQISAGIKHFATAHLNSGLTTTKTKKL